MIDVLHREFVYLWYYFEVQLEQVFMFWVLGMLIGSAVSVFGKNLIHNLFVSISGKKYGVFGIVLASMLGILSPLCMYGTIPIAASFSKRGMQDDWLAAFMMSSIMLNPQLFIYSLSLGTDMAMVRLIVSSICGIVAGLCIRIFFKEKNFFNFTKMQEPSNRDTDPNLLLRYLKNVWRNVKATGVYFLFGIMLSALFQRYIPAEWIADLFGSQRGFGVLLAATIGVPLYACGGGTIPLLMEWLNSGMSAGSATAFMITGPATKITNLGAVKIVLGAKNFGLYLVYIMLFSMISGGIVNFIYAF
ncbi:MAG: permease [Clostridia bacterium]|nr:permease [Lachnospiraceae bacterium]NCC01142.1 permease [Clostridia bacterium]NCD03041.1 permease [Clostridia bacterium]